MINEFIEQYYKQVIGIIIATLLAMLGINNVKTKDNKKEIVTDNSIHVGDITGRDITIGR